MKPSIKYPVRVFVTGVVVLTLLSIPLFWLRFLCQISLSKRIPSDVKDVSIEPSSLVPRDIENDPNIARHSRVSATMRCEIPLTLRTLGILDYFQARLPGGRRSNVFLIESNGEWMYFDQKLGQIVLRYIDKQIMPDGSPLRRTLQLYAGPEGISEISDKKLGRFIDPIVDTSNLDGSLKSEPMILYDKKLRSFFKIDIRQKTVFKGPKLGTEDSHEPVQIGQLNKYPFLLDLNWLPPAIKISSDYRIAHGREYEPLIQTAQRSNTDSHLFVLDKSGRIDLLDQETLEFAGTAGKLPEPRTLFGSEQSAAPKNTLSYKAKPLYLGARTIAGISESKRKKNPDKSPLRYAGMFVASLSSDGTALAVTVFDDKGKVSRRAHSELGGNRSHRGARRSSSSAVYFGPPWAPALTIGKYLAENLHPPILSLASYFAASAFEASAGHRALFILPNSFIAMMGRDVTGNMVGRFGLGLLLILPSLILAILLAWRVSEDATVVGLSENAKLFWMLGTIGFGLAAYITYRLTRPKMVLVTCQNCGNPRRPDMSKCHRCGSKWHVPELTPPTWRVLG